MKKEQKYTLANPELRGLILTKKEWEDFIHELWFMDCCDRRRNNEEELSKEEFSKTYEVIPYPIAKPKNEKV